MCVYVRVCVCVCICVRACVCVCVCACVCACVCGFVGVGVGVRVGGGVGGCGCGCRCVWACMCTWSVSALWGPLQRMSAHPGDTCGAVDLSYGRLQGPVGKRRAKFVGWTAVRLWFFNPSETRADLRVHSLDRKRGVHVIVP